MKESNVVHLPTKASQDKEKETEGSLTDEDKRLLEDMDRHSARYPWHDEDQNS